MKFQKVDNYSFSPEDQTDKWRPFWEPVHPPQRIQKYFARPSATTSSRSSVSTCREAIGNFKKEQKKRRTRWLKISNSTPKKSTKTVPRAEYSCRETRNPGLGGGEVFDNEEEDQEEKEIILDLKL